MGNYLLIHGEGQDHSYFYAHSRGPPWSTAASVSTLASESARWGETGNAITVAATFTSRSMSAAGHRPRVGLCRESPSGPMFLKARDDSGTN